MAPLMFLLAFGGGSSSSVNAKRLEAERVGEAVLWAHQ